VSESLLARATAVTEAIVAAGEPVGPRALARATGIDRSAVGRILRQLAELGILTAENGSYSPGARLFKIGRVLSALDTLPAAANAALSSLVDEFDETSYVCTWQENSAVFLYEGQSSKPLRYVIELGRPVPLHAGAAGRAILSGLPAETVRELFSGDGLKQRSPTSRHLSNNAPATARSATRSVAKSASRVGLQLRRRSSTALPSARVRS
jgi:DNA-binding IclR family transcriptional regulator